MPAAMGCPKLLILQKVKQAELVRSAQHGVGGGVGWGGGGQAELGQDVVRQPSCPQK